MDIGATCVLETLKLVQGLVEALPYRRFVAGEFGEGVCLVCIPHEGSTERGVPRADDRRVVSGIIHVIRNGLRWRDAPADYGPHKTLYNRFVRWSRMGIFHRILACLAAEGEPPDLLMIDGTHLKVHRTAASLLKGGILPAA